MKKKSLWLMVLILLAAFGLRVWHLASVPPGWRDDELINMLVLSQKIRAGEAAFFYPDASGHEALVHGLREGILILLGNNLLGARFLSVIMGTLGVALLYRFGGRLFGRRTGLLAAALLAVSFWSLMYSRFGLRHIALPVFLLLIFDSWWEGLTTGEKRPFFRAGIWLGLAFYTYFAARGIPLILLAFFLLLFLFARPLAFRRWRGLLLTFATAFILALPLIFTLQAQPAAEARVAELAVPVVELRQGNWQPLAIFTATTLRMFTSTGDHEWLYNIPDRPVFNGVVGTFFWLTLISLLLGILLSTVFPTFLHRFSTKNNELSPENPPRSQQKSPDNPQFYPQTGLLFLFLLLWWAAGIAPGFISVPPASYGHTILAQPATYLILALAPSILAASYKKRYRGLYLILLQISADLRGIYRINEEGYNINREISSLKREMNNERMSKSNGVWFLAATIIFLLVAQRDIPAYFVEWPSRGNTRFLYRADIADLGSYLEAHQELTATAVGGLLAGPWDRAALGLELGSAPVQVRWFNPARALFIEPAAQFTGHPVQEERYELWLHPVSGAQAGGYRFANAVVPVQLPDEPEICFVNGLCLLSGRYQTGELHLFWQAKTTIDLPPEKIISNPPPPGLYSGPRLHVFAQLLDSEGNFVQGDDGLWVDPYTLLAGDRFVQLHRLNEVTLNGGQIIIGLYDPFDGRRILTTTGADYYQLQPEEMR